MNEKVYFAIMGVEFALLCMAAAGLFMGGAKIQRLEMEVDCLCTANGCLEADEEVLTEKVAALEKELEVARRNDMEHDPITGKWTKKKGKKV